MQSNPPRDLFSAVHHYWRERKGDGLMPSRREIDPAALTPYLPYLMLIDVEGPQFRYRLVGTQVVGDMERDPTGIIFGTYLSTNRFAADLIGQLCRVRDRGEVLFTTGLFRTPDSTLHSTARLLMPLGEKQDVRMILQVRAARYPEKVDNAIDWFESTEGVVLETLPIQAEVELERPVAAWFESTIEPTRHPNDFTLRSRKAEGFG